MLLSILRRQKRMQVSVEQGVLTRAVKNTLGVMARETVTLAVNASNKPVRLIDSGDPASVYVIMGMDL
jgi:DNA polymerase III sliding clamp (beta) subunit (PCNA family)